MSLTNPYVEAFMAAYLLLVYGRPHLWIVRAHLASHQRRRLLEDRFFSLDDSQRRTLLKSVFCNRLNDLFDSNVPNNLRTLAVELAREPDAQQITHDWHQIEECNARYLLARSLNN